MSTNATGTTSQPAKAGHGSSAPQTPAQIQAKAFKQLGEHDFPIYSWYILACVIGLATLHNVFYTLWAWRRRRLYQSSSLSSPSSNAFPLRAARALSAAYTRTMYWRRIPMVSMAMLEVLLMVLYIVMLFTMEFTYTQNLTVKLWANRTGHLIGIQFPLIVALGAKHNIIGYLTGLSHEKLNLMHRVTARVILVLTWVHLFGTLRDRGLKRWLHAPWVTCGMVAGVAMTLLVLTSLGPIRRRFYEFFYVCHMILVIITLVCTVIHCKEPGYGIYIWPCFALWGFDRLCRYIRFVSFNSFFVSRKCTGTVEVVTTDTLRLTMRRRVPFGWKAGQHMFLSFPTVHPLQSHPFTISTVYEGSRLGLGGIQELIFITRARNGLTRSLYDKVLDTGSMDLPILVDGPYGAPPDITPFSTCIFVAGGSGITYNLPRFEDVVRRASTGDACARRITFVWAIRDKGHLKSIAGRFSTIMAQAPTTLVVSIQIYVTSPPPSLEELEKNIADSDSKRFSQDSNDKKSDVLSFEESNDSIVFYEGRPDVMKILESEVKASEGPVSVDASGPVPLLSDIRTALCAPFTGPVHVLRGAQTVQLNVAEYSL
ncbi:hypothetical protein EIP91_000052 [Steccherinum ochraceum]|uniref:ferric-chelate reductase (NADPH) n=1 Tax=Steccherinum ochraceum TaxID=92696 RepID=A0A4R0RSI9_9APHY|nr:hypothetical protein EIP91_000052 [Steccherinum ochraceum]